jgi:hypothetical protein
MKRGVSSGHLVLAEKKRIGTFEYDIEGEVPEIDGFTLPERP